MTMKRFLRGIRVGFECILRLPFINWFNPILTLYLNFRSFPIGQAVRFPVFVYGWPKLFTLLGNMVCKDCCRIGMVKFNTTNIGGPNHSGSDSAINNWGTIIFHGPCEIHTGIKINVYRFATLDIGCRCHVMPCCNITANDFVFIGTGSKIAHRSQIIDSNYHYTADLEKKIIKKYRKAIYIGEYVWICNNVSVSAGTKIPSHTIVASNSMVNKDFSDIPENSIIGGSPAKILKKNCRRIFNKKFDSSLNNWFRENPDCDTYLLDEEFDVMMCD